MKRFSVVEFNFETIEARSLFLQAEDAVDAMCKFYCAEDLRDDYIAELAANTAKRLTARESQGLCRLHNGVWQFKSDEVLTVFTEL